MTKKLGCSFPVLVLVIVGIVALLAVGLISGPLGKSLFGDLGLPKWIPTPEPKIELPASVVFEVFGFPITNTVVSAWITIVFLVGMSYLITRRMKQVPGRLQSVFEALLGWVYGFCNRVAGEKNGRRFFPLVCTIFLFVAFNAWLSLLPGYGSIEIVNTHGEHVHLLRGANTDINFPLALALVSFVFVEFNGLRAHGIRYLGKFFNLGAILHGIGQMFKGKVLKGLGGIGLGIINAFVGIIELLSELIRILSLTARLFGNMTAGEILLVVIAFLVPWVISDVFYGLELLIGFVQALVFGGLTLVYLTMAVQAHGEH